MVSDRWATLPVCCATLVHIFAILIQFSSVVSLRCVRHLMVPPSRLIVLWSRIASLACGLSSAVSLEHGLRRARPRARSSSCAVSSRAVPLLHDARSSSLVLISYRSLCTLVCPPSCAVSPSCVLLARCSACVVSLRPLSVCYCLSLSGSGFAVGICYPPVSIGVRPALRFLELSTTGLTPRRH